MNQLMDTTVGKGVRLERVVRRSEGGMFLVPLDHSVANGPVVDADRFPGLIDTISRCGADGVVVHKGRVRFVPPHALRYLTLVVHMSASTRHAADGDRKVLVTGVEEALQLGADMVSVHVNMGTDSEAAQLADLGRVADQCLRWGVPLMAMVYPRSSRIASEQNPDAVAHAANLAADLGADVVKTPYTGDPDTMADVVRSCPIPIVTAGGGRASHHELVATVADVMRSGAAGVAVGRNVFEATDVAGVIRGIAGIVHRQRHDVLPVPRAVTA